MKVGFVSLGCCKNLVDSEMIMGMLKENHHQIVSNPRQAEAIIINTCGFIDSAKEESINTIFEMAKYKEAIRYYKKFLELKQFSEDAVFARNRVEELREQYFSKDNKFTVIK